jgi:hypothetical protein
MGGVCEIFQAVLVGTAIEVGHEGATDHAGIAVIFFDYQDETLPN